MRNLKFCLLVVLTLGIFATSCKKDSDPSTTELLTIEGGWKIDGFSSNSEEIGDAFVALFIQLFPPEQQTPQNEALIRESFDLDLQDGLDACDQDNVLFFHSDGTVTEATGSVKCDPSEPDEGSAGTWTLSADEKTLTITDVDGDAFGYEIGSISSSRLELLVKQSLMDDLDEEDLAEVEGLEGYDEFINLDIIITLTLRAN